MNDDAETFPAPRVMSAAKLWVRHCNDSESMPSESELVQVWAVGHDEPYRGQEVLLVAYSPLSGNGEASVVFSMLRRTFEAQMPLSVLLDTPSDPSALDAIDIGPTEGSVLEVTGTQPKIRVAAAEAMMLMKKWMSDRTPIRETRSFMRRALPLVSPEMAGSYVEACQILETKNIDGEGRMTIAGLCMVFGMILNDVEGE